MSGRDPAGRRGRWIAGTVLVVAALALAGSVGWAASGLVWQQSTASSVPGIAGQPWTRQAPGGQAGGAGNRSGVGMGNQTGGMGNRSGGGMMGGRVWLAGDGTPIKTIAQARARATQAASSAGLHSGEVMQFSDNFFVELKNDADAATAEVLVDPDTGAVTTEPGPAMTWTTGTAVITADQAKVIADQWLRTNAKGQTVSSTDAFPGHFTMDTTAGGVTVGMLSVNVVTGAVWYHTWHGTFIAEEDA